MSKKLDPTRPVPFPAVVTIDSREQTPFAFAGIFADIRDGGGPLVVETARGTLLSGDYSVAGLEEVVAVERKSLADLYSTIGQGRDRFVRELARLHDMRFAAVVVEADWSNILRSPPPHTSLSPKTIFRSVVAWQQRYPRVHWWFCSDRRLAEIATLRILERAWKDLRGWTALAPEGLSPGNSELQDAPAGFQAIALDLLAANHRLRLNHPSDRRLVQRQFNELAIAMAKATLREVGDTETASACVLEWDGEKVE